MGDKAIAVAAWESLFRAQVTVMRNLNSEFPSAEISFNEYDVCFNLSRQPGRRARMRDLMGFLLLTQPSVSRLVDRLSARGIVEKLADPTDARGVIVALTAHGYDVYRSVAVQHAATIARQVGAGLTDNELRTLDALCTKLRLATGEEAVDTSECDAVEAAQDDEQTTNAREARLADPADAAARSDAAAPATTAGAA